MNHFCPRAKKILVVNKCDLKDCKDGLTDESLNAASNYMKMDAMFRVSAKTGEKVEDLLKAAGRLSLERKRGKRELCSLL